MSGWTYAPWRGEFYPKGLRQADELAYASSKVTSIELNGSFYSLQKPASWQKWRDETPDDFVFAVKGPRFITHIKRLDEVDEPLANFFASGILALGAQARPDALAASAEPRVRRGASSRSSSPSCRTRRRRPSPWRRSGASGCRARSTWRRDAERPLRHAVEPRSHSFDDQEFATLLEKHGVAAVLGDSAGRWPKLDWVTADFAYARLHGDKELYTSGYDEAGLDTWEEWTRDHLDHGRTRTSTSTTT